MSSDPAEDLSLDSADASTDRDRFFDWYHHAVVLAYSVTATVSSWSGSLRDAAVLFVGSILLAYVVVAVLTIAVRRFAPPWFP